MNCDWVDVAHSGSDYGEPCVVSADCSGSNFYAAFLGLVVRSGSSCDDHVPMPAVVGYDG